MSRRARFGLTALFLAASIGLLIDSLRGAIGPTGSARSTIYLRSQLLLPPAATGLAIPIAPMLELDGLTRAAVYRVRRDAVGPHRHLLEGGYYRPSDAVFGQILDRKPWWGIDGIYFHGPGPRSHEGASEETRFLANPFLLVGVAESCAWITRGRTPFELFPLPAGLTYFEAGRRTVRVRYDVGRFFRSIEAMRYYHAELHELTIIAYNARDLGLPYLSIDRARTENVLAPPSGIVAIRQYLHTGGSCGKASGCNNMSPHQPELEIRVPRLPARLHLRLYGEPPPARADAQADLEYVLEME